MLHQVISEHLETFLEQAPEPAIAERDLSPRQIPAIPVNAKVNGRDVDV